MSKKVWWIAGCFCLCALVLAMKVEAEVSESAGPLDGVAIVVDPGHGGKDDGARAEGVKEQEINLAISIQLKSELESLGAQVTLTRDGAYDLASEGAANRKREDMKKRVALINEEPTDLFISVHLNSYPNTAIHGAHAFYEKGDDSSKQLAEIIQKRFNALTKDEKDSKTGDYYILNETRRPGVLVECGFLSNAQDRAKLTQEAYQKDLAKAISESIVEYLDAWTM